MVEWVEHQGEHYLRIDPQMVDFANAGTVHKVTEDFAVRLNTSIAHIPTIIDGHVETVNHAHLGDWIVYNIGNVDPRSIAGYDAMNEEEKILARAQRSECYILDDATFTAAHGEPRAAAHGVLAAPKSEPRPAITLPFNAVFTASWGSDEFVKAGSYLVKNGEKIYGIARDTFHNTYGAIDENRPFATTHRAQISARTMLMPEAGFAPKVADVYAHAVAARRSKED